MSASPVPLPAGGASSTAAPTPTTSAASSSATAPTQPPALPSYPAASPAQSMPPSSVSTIQQPGMVITQIPPPMPPQNVRVENGFVIDKIDKPFVYGSAAFWQVLYHAPYEVTETGWGEFSIGITINFHESSGLDPIQLQHMLKLFPGQNIQPTTKKPVMSEVYDEFVFVNPSKEWFDRLHSGPTKKIDHHPLMPYFITPEFAKDEDMAIAKLQAANETIQMQIDQQRAKLYLLDQDIANLTQKL